MNFGKLLKYQVPSCKVVEREHGALGKIRTGGYPLFDGRNVALYTTRYKL
jgi:hypothetical protein